MKTTARMIYSYAILVFMIIAGSFSACPNAGNADLDISKSSSPDAVPADPDQEGAVDIEGGTIYVKGKSNPCPGFLSLKEPIEFSNQNNCERVRLSREIHNADIAELFCRAKVNYPPSGLFIRVFKSERVVEVWAQPSSGEKYRHIRDYEICRISGKLGPKRRQGDRQIPEGAYRINRFNCWSRFHLSLGINYPNASDKVLGHANPGGDIFIHGDCVTIGCIPITDWEIEELYIVVLDSVEAGGTVPVHLFPFRMTDRNLKSFGSGYETLIPFWRRLKSVYDAFETDRVIPIVLISKGGEYVLAPKNQPGRSAPRRHSGQAAPDGPVQENRKNPSRFARYPNPKGCIIAGTAQQDWLNGSKRVTDTSVSRLPTGAVNRRED